MKPNTFSLASLTCLLAASVTQAATVSTFTGGDIGEGIDFSGNVIHAINIGGGGTGLPAAADLLVSGVTFKDAYANANLIPGVAPNWTAIDNWSNQPNYGSSVNDNNLEQVMWDIGHNGTSANLPSLVFTGLAANQLFQLQVLASDNVLTVNRHNSYQLFTGNFNGASTLADQSLNNNLTTLQGGSVTKGVVITLQGMSDASGVLSFRALNGTTGTDNNSIASAVILTQIPEPSSAFLLSLGCLALISRRRKG